MTVVLGTTIRSEQLLFILKNLLNFYASWLCERQHQAGIAPEIYFLHEKFVRNLDDQILFAGDFGRFTKTIRHISTTHGMQCIVRYLQWLFSHIVCSVQLAMHRPRHSLPEREKQISSDFRVLHMMRNANWNWECFTLSVGAVRSSFHYVKWMNLWLAQLSHSNARCLQRTYVV